MFLRLFAPALALVGLFWLSGLAALNPPRPLAHPAVVAPLASAAPALITHTLALPLVLRGASPNQLIFTNQVDQLRWFPNYLELAYTDGSSKQTLAQCPYTMHLAWAPNSQRIAFICQGQVAVVNVNGSGQFTASTATDHYFPNWLSDATLLFAAPRGPNATFQLYTLQVATGIETPFTLNVSLTRTWNPLVAPNLQKLVFNGPNEVVYVTNADGTATHALQKPGGAIASGAIGGWYADSEQLLFSDNTTTPATCTRLRLDGSAAVAVNFPTCEVSFAPDGSQAVYYFDRDIWIMNGDGQNRQIIWDAPNWGANFYFAPQWRPGPVTP